jgi:hypothetical protein
MPARICDEIDVAEIKSLLRIYLRLITAATRTGGRNDLSITIVNDIGYDGNLPKGEWGEGGRKGQE